MAELWWKISKKKRLKALLCEVVPWKEIYYQAFGWDGDSNIPCFMAERKEEHENGLDEKASMGVVPGTCGAVNCFTCGYRTSSFLGTLEDWLEVPFEEACRRVYRDHVEPIVSDEVVANLTKNLVRDSALLNEVMSRLRLTLKEVSRWRLGWSIKRRRLAVPIENEYGWVVDVRCYDVMGMHEDKVMSWRKGFGKTRLFPFSDGDRCVLTEGEKDLMAASSIGLPAQTITGGARSMTAEIADKYFKGREVYLPFDNDAAGRSGAEKRADMIVGGGGKAALVTLPVKEKGEDVWDWVHKYGGTLEEFWKLPVKWVGGDGAQLKSPSGLSWDVGSVFRDGPKNDVAKAEMVFRLMEDNGWFYRNGDLVYYSTGSECAEVSRRNPEFRCLMAGISPFINKETATGKVVLEHVENMSRRRAGAVEVSNQYHYSGSGTFYFKAARKSQFVYACRDGRMDEVRNGSNDDKVLLSMEDYALSDVARPEKVRWKRAVRWLWERVFKFMPMPDDQRMVVMLWLLAGFFKQITPDRPILRLMAPSSQGKSHVLRMISFLMYGGEFVDGPSTTVASLSTNAVKRPVLLLDNIEMEHVQRNEGLNDLFVSLATTVAKEKRKMGTDTGVVHERPNCITATTGIEPFSRHEVINRFLYIPVDRVKYGRDDYFDFTKFQEIKDNRSWVLWGLYKAALAVLPLIKEGVRPAAARFAAADRYVRYPVYLALMEAWAALVLRVVVGGEPSKVMDEVVRSQGERISDQSEGTDPVLAWLDTWWVRTAPGSALFSDSSYRPHVDGGGRRFTWWLSPTELLNELSQVSRSLGRRVPWVNAQQLGCRISDSAATLKDAGWDVTRSRSGGRNQLKLVKTGRLPDGSAPIVEEGPRGESKKVVGRKRA